MEDKDCLSRSRGNEDPRFDLLSTYVLTTMRLKQDRWNKMIATENLKVIVLDWLNNVHRRILLFTLNTAGFLIPKISFTIIDPSSSGGVLVTGRSVNNVGGLDYDDGASSKNTRIINNTQPIVGSSFSTLDGSRHGKSVFFLKKQLIAITLENFHNVIQFGDLPIHSTIKTLAILFNEIYAPLLSNPCNRQLWPTIVSQDIDKQMKELRNILNELKGKESSKTVLSITVSQELILKVEKEILDGNLTECDVNLKNNLEGMVINWITQIHESINENGESAAKNNIISNMCILPVNEINYWNNRKTNLLNLYEQLKSPGIKAVATILEKIDSVYYGSFNKIFKELILALHEALDLSLWFGPLLRYTSSFGSVNFINAFDLIDPLIHIVHLLWTKSQYSCTTKRSSVLVCALCNLLVLRASEDLQIPMLFTSDADEGLMKISKTIDILEYFKLNIFEFKPKMKSTDASSQQEDLQPNISPLQLSRFHVDKTFEKLNNFLLQLIELKKVFETAVCFQKLEKLEIGGLRGKFLTNQIKQIYENFRELFQEWTLIDINISSTGLKWKKFRKQQAYFFQTSEVFEMKLATVIMRSFEDCHNTQQFNKLTIMFGNILNRSIIRSKLKILPKMYKLMENDLTQIENCFKKVQSDFEQNGLNAIPKDKNFSPIAGSLMWIQKINNRIQLNSNEILQDILFEDDKIENVHLSERRKRDVLELEQLKEKIWMGWITSIEDKIITGLNQKIFILQKNDLKYLEINWADELFAMIKETKYLLAMEIKNIPTAVLDLYEMRDDFWNRRLQLIRIQDSYNSIRKDCRPCEFDLINLEMTILEENILDACDKVTWKIFDSELVSKIFDGSQTLCERIKKSQKNLDFVLDNIKKWSREPLNRRNLLAKNYLDLRYQKERFKTRLQQCEKSRDLLSMIMQKNFFLFFDYSDGESLTQIPNKDFCLLKFLSNYPKHQFDLYQKYISFVDDLIYDEILKSIQISLDYIKSEIINSSEENGIPLFEIKLELFEMEIKFQPTFDTNVDSNFLQIINNLIDDIFKICKFIPRICKERSFDNFNENSMLKSLSEFIIQSANNAMADAKKFSLNFLDFEFLWLNNKEEHLNSLLRSNQNTQFKYNGFTLLENFKKEIDRFNELHEEIENIDTFYTFNGWLAVDINPFKYALLNHVCKWANLYKQWLLAYVNNTLKELNAFISKGMGLLTVEVSEEDINTLLSVMSILVQIKERESDADNMFKPLKDIIVQLKSYGVEFDSGIFKTIEELPLKWMNLKKFGIKRSQELAPIQEHQQKVIASLVQLFNCYLNNFREKFTQMAFFWNPCDEVYILCDKVSGKIRNFQKRMKKLTHCAKLLGVTPPDDAGLKLCSIEVKKIKQLWDFVRVIESCIIDWKSTPWCQIDTDDMENECRKFTRDLRTLDKSIRLWQPYIYIEGVLKDLVSSFRAITELQNSAITDRHWIELMHATKLKYKTIPSTTLDKILTLKLHYFEEDVKNTVDRAVKEMTVNKVLHDIKETWKSIEFANELHHQRNLQLLKVSEELIETLDDNQMQLQNIATSKHIDFLLPKIIEWQVVLSKVDLLISHWFEVQRKWLYLESIFIGSVDIRSQLPEDSERFELIDFEFTQLLNIINETKIVIKVTEIDGIYNRLEQLAEKLVVCEKALNNYLETKRIAFPRFYFISSADLLDILSNGNSPKSIDRHLIKLFDSILRLELISTNIDGESVTNIAIGMHSKENEEFVEFKQQINCSGRVELWLNGIINAMKNTLHALFKDSLDSFARKSRDQWLFDWPAQTSLCCSQISWTTDVNHAFAWLEEGYETSMKDLQKRQIAQLNALINLLLGELSAGDRQKIMTICTIDVHCRDVVLKIIQSKVENSLAFQWQSQLRHRWDNRKDDCFANICDAEFQYAYEYLGNTSRLVITPLTDRCFITLTQSLHLVMGGAPAGPAGTGKTETTKDLGRALGVMVYVFNCSEQMDYKSCGNIYKGLSQTGGWGCFDEFNRISVEVLSVVAVQVKTIQDAIKMRRTHFVFMGETIPLVPTVGIFVTMNPGYAGRTELPENLKTLFRPCAMIVPDFALICEIMLIAEGFQDAKLLARKFITLYTLCRELLSKQDHYDWGLRAIKSVLVVAGTLKRDDHSRPEDQVLMRALRDFNIPKIVTEDVPIFMGLIGDLFPALDVPRKRIFNFEKTIRKAVNETKLQPEEGFLMKIVQLQELLDVRHSVFIVGNAGTGKTKIWQTLLATYTIQKIKPVCNVLNPKALTNDELFGIVNPTTREWKDGLFSLIMRDQANLPNGYPKWIVLDGDIDPMWIESLNTLMDDNKVLTLASNERISLQKDMRLLFEVGHLKAATPATVSRAGILYINPQDLGWFPYVSSWLETRTDIIERGLFTGLFEKYFPSIVSHSQEFKKTTPITEMSMIQMTCYLLECLLENHEFPADELETSLEVIFVYAAIWGFGSGLYQDQIIDWHREFHKWWIQEFKDIKFPSHGTVFDFYLDMSTLKFIEWENLQTKFEFDSEIPLQNILVPTAETERLQYFLKLLVNRTRPVMVVGNSGCGKGAIFREILNSYTDEIIVQKSHFNFYTSSEIFQKNLDRPLEKKSGRSYGPSGNKRLIYFINDLNMPEVDSYGTVQPHTIIRQFMDYRQWYDRNKLILKDIQKCQFAACMNPTAGSFTIDPRLQRHFCIFSVSSPSEETLNKIYSNILNHHLENPLNNFNKEIKSIGNLLVSVGIALHRRIENAFLPTAVKFHYIFNLRDMTNIYQGLMNSTNASCTNPTELMRFYVHEAFRVYHDRLVDQYDIKSFKTSIRDIFKKDFDDFDEDSVFAEPLIYCHFAQSLVDQKYFPVRSWKDLYELLMEAQNNFNEIVGYMSLVMFEDAMLHICRINRILESPRGNALLIGVGGSGKQTLARLASFISSLGVFQIQLKRGYCLQDMKEDLANLYTKVGLKNVSSVFLLSDAQIPDESILMLCNDMLASGEIPELFSEDQFDSIVNGIRNEVKQTGTIDTKDNCWKYFIEKVRRLLKIVLCFSPVGPTLRIRARKFPAIISRTSIDWFHEWPKSALESVSKKFLSEIDVLPNDLMEPIACFMSYVHGTVNQISKIYLQNEKRYNYTTPKTYLEYIALYSKLLMEKSGQHMQRIDRLENGMSKLEQCAKQVDILQDQLEIQEIELNAKNAAADKLIRIVSAENEKVKREKSIASEEEQRVRIIEEDVCMKTKLCEEDLRKAEPALVAAQAALNTLNKNNLTELKSFGSPPKAVVNVCTAVMVLFATNGKIPKDRSWRSAKLMMGRVDQFLSDLVNYDKDNIHINIIEALQEYLKDPEFNPDKIVQKSVAAAGLCAWVINLHRYHEVFLIVGPKQQALEDSQDELQEARERLEYLKKKIIDLESKLHNIQMEFEKALAEKQKCQCEADRTAFTIDLAHRLVNGLANENVRWRESVSSLREKIGTLPGDILLISSFLSYVGCFTRRYRQELQEKMWMPTFKKIQPSIPHTEGVDPITLISDDAQIAVWNNEGLPMDQMSTENATILTNSTRWPLMIDPQLQGIKWIKNRFVEDLIVIRITQKGYLEIIEKAMARGQTVLLEQIGEVLDAVLEPLLSRALIKKGRYIRIGDKEMDFSSNFRLILHTKLANPHYKPEMQAQTTLINFTVTRDGLEEQLLAEVVKIERPDLEEMKTEVTIQQNKFKISLKSLEDDLLARLASSGKNVLAEHALVLNLEATKRTVDEIETKVIEAKITTLQIDETRNIYRAAAKRASILYFVLNDLSKINPIYRFSLKAFMTVFKQAITMAPPNKGLDKRVASLVDSITYQTFLYTLRGLFERDKLTFTSHMMLRIMIHSQQITKDEVDFLLRYPHDPNTLSPFDFIARSSWGGIKTLAMMEHFYGIDKDIENYTNRWKKFLANDAPEKEIFPGEWKLRTPSERLCIIRALRPDRMTYAMRLFIEQTMGKSYSQVQLLPFAEMFKDVTSSTPIFFILSPGIDPVRDIEKLGQNLNISNEQGNLRNISLGQGQETIAENAIDIATGVGQWVILQNIHLVVNWLPTLEKLIEKTSENSHPDYRLFISAEPAPDPQYHIIPQGILESSIKIVNEPPSGMAANLHKAWDSFNEETLETCTQEAEFKSILFALCYFHAVAGERRKFGPQGWNKVYPFNVGDLTISANVLHNYLEGSNRIPWEDLRYLFGEIMYGGHITDDWDRRLCQTYLEELLQQNLIDGDFELCARFPSPPNLDFNGYHTYIDTFLPDESPILYGLHPNAEIGFLTTASEILLKTIFELQPRESELSSHCGAPREELVKIMIDDILDKLQDEFNIDSLLIRVEKKTPFVVVALQECERMNVLIREIKRSLRELMLGLKGELTITTEMEKLENALFYDYTPEVWSKLAYPSLMGLQSWFNDLIQRIKELGSWLNDFKLPCAIWLGGLFNPQSFLTAIMQESARKNDLPLDRMCLSCDVTKKDKDDVTLPPKEGAFIYGLFLDGASWSCKLNSIVPLQPKQLFARMPVIFVKSIIQEKFELQRAYECPLYKTKARGNTYVWTFNLKTKEKPAKWILGGVALLMQS